LNPSHEKHRDSYRGETKHFLIAEHPEELENPFDQEHRAISEAS